MMKEKFNQDIYSTMAKGPEVEEMSSEDPQDYDDDRAYYEIPDEEVDKPKNDGEGPLKFVKLLFKLLISPRVGWRNVRRSHLTGDRTCRGIFYPLVALASASNFVNLAFDPELTITEEIINGIVTFASFFFSYFLVFPLGRLLLKGTGAEIIGTEFGKTFIAFAMSTLALFYILYELLPMIEPIIVLLPLWTIFVITRGIKILRIPEDDQTSATVWLSLLIVGLPVGVGYFFDLILP